MLASCGGAVERGFENGDRVAQAARAPATATASPTSRATSDRQRVEVISVTDGDTIRVRIDGQSVPVRYIGIDTPETVDPRKEVECFGREASAFNTQLVAGKIVELEKDVSETDRFGRLLRYVYVEGRMVNEELVRGGYATAVSYPPDVKYQDSLRSLEAEARATGVGLWAEGACAAATPAPTVAPTVAVTAAPTAGVAAHSVQLTVTSPVRRGSKATATAVSSAGAACTITVTYKSGPSAAQGLGPKTADGAGAVSWSWTVGSSTTFGSWPVDVTCTSTAGQRATARQFFAVQ